MNNRTFLLLFYLTLLQSNSIFSQIDFNPLRYYNPFPASPNVSTLGKFGDIPVGTYTGIPQIEIPLYTVKVRDYELPLSLKYHASGIKVSEEASYVGLGWALEAGGVIAQIVNDRNDLGFGIGYNDFGYINANTPDPCLSGDQYYQPYTGQSCPPNLTYTGVDVDYDAINIPYCQVEQNTSGEFSDPFYDTEPDIFMYSCGSYSGKFFWDKSSNSFQTFDRNKISITYEKTSELDRWKLTTPDGIIYIFSQLETYQTCTENVDVNPSGVMGPCYNYLKFRTNLTIDKQIVALYYSIIGDETEFIC